VPTRFAYGQKRRRSNPRIGAGINLPGPPKAPRKPPRHWESELQVMLNRWFALAVRPEHAKLFSIPNGDERDAHVQDRLKDEGLCPGATDLVLLLPRGKVCWVEVKTAADPAWGVRRTELSSVQKTFHGWLAHFGHDRAVVRSPEEFCDLLDRYGVPYAHRPLMARPRPPVPAIRLS
jgi:hypothetical protein